MCAPPYDLQTVFAVFFTAFGIGLAFQFAPDFAKAGAGEELSCGAVVHCSIASHSHLNCVAARDSVFAIIDRKSAIDSASTEGDQADFNTGDVVFDGVRFAYPTRPGAEVLKGLDLRVPVCIW